MTLYKENHDMEETKQTQQVATLKPRNVAIDLLKIIAILLICLSHASQTLRGLYEFPFYGPSNIVSTLFYSFGTIGNVLFIICSSYFLVDKGTARGEKALNILFDSTLISISIMVGFLVAREPLTWDTIKQLIFPDVFATNWFVPCYVIFYLLSPIVVHGLKHLNDKQHFCLIILSLIVYGGLSLISIFPVGSTLLQFFYILNIVAFIRWRAPFIYNHRVGNLVFFLVGIALCYLGYFGFIILARYNEHFNKMMFMQMYSPFVILPLIALFNVFVTFKFENKFISYLSQCTLFVYVIHENYLLRSITRVKYYQWAFAIYGESLTLVYMLICGLFMFVVGFVLAIIYKETLARLTSIASRKVSILIDKVLSWLFTKSVGNKQEKLNSEIKNEE